MLEFNEWDSVILDKIMGTLKHHSNLENTEISDEMVLSFPGLEIYLDRRRVYCNHQEIRLTAKEFNLLCLLVTNKGRVLTYDQIYQKVWGEEAIGNENNAIACHIHNLREKIYEVLPEALFSIRCVREVGYCFEVICE